MSDISTKLRPERVLLAVVLLAMAGCSYVQLPKVDPTGERLFSEGFFPEQPNHLPRPSTTSTEISYVTVTPQNAFAPVGSEVILVGSVVLDGYYSVGRRLEWVISQESVGQFVSVGKKDAVDWMLLNFNIPGRRDNDYAVGTTLRNYHVLTRGTPVQNDDIPVLAGQGWVTLTSSAPGTSLVSLTCPGVNPWARRTTTATITWLDVQWQFPAPAVVPVGNTHALRTMVKKHTGCGGPISGWMVRYSIDQNCPAAFLPNGTKVVIVPVDATGFAAVEIAATTDQPCVSAPVTIELIPPPEISTAPRVDASSITVTWAATAEATGAVQPTYDSSEGIVGAVGQGGDVIESSVDPTQPLSAPAQDVKVQVIGPTEAAVGEKISFQIQVANHGTAAASGLTVSDTYDAGLRHPTSTANPMVVRIDSLGPGQVQQVDLQFEVVSPGEWCHEVILSDASGTLDRQQSCVTAEATTGTPPGLPIQAPEGTGGTEFPPAPSPTDIEATLSVEKTGPATGPVGGTADFTISLTNTGSTTLRNIRVIDYYDLEKMTPATASEGYFFPENGKDIAWTIPEIRPGESEERYVIYRLLKPGSVQTKTSAYADNGARAETIVPMIITGTAPGAPIEPGFPPPGTSESLDRPVPPVGVDPRSDGNLTVTISDAIDPVELNKEVTYEIRVTNSSAITHRNVEVLVSLPDGMTAVPLRTGGAAQPLISEDSQEIQFKPITSVPPGKTLTYRVGVVTKKVGTLQLGARVTSLDQAGPTVRQEITTVYPAN